MFHPHTFHFFFNQNIVIQQFPPLKVPSKKFRFNMFPAQFDEETFRQSFGYTLSIVLPIGTLAFGLIQCRRKKKAPENDKPAAAPNAPAKSNLTIGAAPLAAPIGIAAAMKKKDEVKKDEPKVSFLLYIFL